MKTAVITGITGQDGSYLAELLIQKNYDVHGISRSPKSAAVQVSTGGGPVVHCSNLLNLDETSQIIRDIQPDEIYHLAGQAFVRTDIADNANLFENNFIPTLNLLTAIKSVKPDTRFFFAGSAEMFGNADHSPQNEETRFNPRSLYGISKVSSSSLVRFYREQWNLFACTGIAFNHESPRRGLNYVTRKITYGAAKIALGLAEKLEIGNVHAQRDWGYAPEFVDAMYRMLQPSTPKDYVISTGKLHSVRNILEITFAHLGLNYEKYISSSDDLFQKAEQVCLQGDSSRIFQDLKWRATKNFKEMICEMVDSDLKLLK